MNQSSSRVVVPDIVELWTFQPRSFYDHLIANGVSWSVNPATDNDDWDEPHDQWAYAYRWLVKQMHAAGIKSVLTPPPEYPVWAWFWWYGENRKHPDLRYFSSWGQRGDTGCVLLKLAVPKEYVALHDYHAWHTVLNHSYFSDSEEDDDAFDELVKLSGHTDTRNLMKLADGPLREKLEKSWMKIFDIGAEPDGHWFEPYARRCLQATLFAIKQEHVKEAWWLPPKGLGGKQKLPI